MAPNREFYKKKTRLNREEILIPLSFFSKKCTVLESVILYLKDERRLNYHQIGILTNRDERNIREAYLTAKLKSDSKKNPSSILIPASIFANRKFSALEAISVYLHDKIGLKFSEIAEILGRDQRTIWTSYSRARKKYGETK